MTLDVLNSEMILLTSIKYYKNNNIVSRSSGEFRRERRRKGSRKDDLSNPTIDFVKPILEVSPVYDETANLKSFCREVITRISDSLSKDQFKRVAMYQQIWYLVSKYQITVENPSDDIVVIVDALCKNHESLVDQTNLIDVDRSPEVNIFDDMNDLPFLYGFENVNTETILEMRKTTELPLKSPELPLKSLQGSAETKSLEPLKTSDNVLEFQQTHSLPTIRKLGRSTTIKELSLFLFTNSDFLISKSLQPNVNGP